jgi:hypothetical protein
VDADVTAVEPDPELPQSLVVYPEPGSHGLHRLPFAIGHQPPQIQLAIGSLISTGQTTEHSLGERLDLWPDLVHLFRIRLVTRSRLARRHHTGPNKGLPGRGVPIIIESFLPVFGQGVR